MTLRRNQVPSTNRLVGFPVTGEPINEGEGLFWNTVENQWDIKKQSQVFLAGHNDNDVSSNSEFFPFVGDRAGSGIESLRECLIGKKMRLKNLFLQTNGVNISNYSFVLRKNNQDTILKIDVSIGQDGFFSNTIDSVDVDIGDFVTYEYQNQSAGTKARGASCEGFTL